MKRRILKENVLIAKKPIFLCGSYYRGSDDDKRSVLKTYLEGIAEAGIRSLYPIIIDGFLSKDRIEDASLSLEIFEEVISRISFANMLFIESFSSAAETGLFTNTSSEAINYLFVPKNKNLIHDKIGYFIKAGILESAINKPGGFIRGCEYQPLVKRAALGTDYADEYYFFKGNALPNEIEAEIEGDMKKLNLESFRPSFKRDCLPRRAGFMEFVIDDAHNTVSLSPKTAFYLIYALALEEATKLENFATIAIDDVLCAKVLGKIQDIVRNSLIVRFDRSLVNAVLNVVFLGVQSETEFIKYSLHFIKYLSTYSDGRPLIVCTPKDMFEVVDDYFDQEANILGAVPDFSAYIFTYRYTKSLKLYKKHRVRVIETYTNDQNGVEYREYHEKANAFLKSFIERYHLSSASSFAYKKGFNCLGCVEKHVGSKYFLKMDIHQFFDSMRKEIVVDAFLKPLQGVPSYECMTQADKNTLLQRVKLFLNSLMVKGRFPIGFITSPQISDLYLLSFDKSAEEYCLNENLIYTRYADDILISSNKPFDGQSAFRFLKSILAGLQLEVNEKKTSFVSLSKPGDYVAFLGLNLVFDSRDGSRITVGNSTIRKLAKLRAYGDKSDYSSRKVAGLEGYIRYNDWQAYKKYLDLVDLYSRKKVKQ